MKPAFFRAASTALLICSSLVFSMATNRIHCSHLHGDVVSLLLSRLVGLNHSAKRVLAHVVVNRNIAALKIEVAVKLGLLAGDTRAGNNLVLHCAAVQRQGLNLVKGLRLCCYGSVEDALCQGDEVCTVGNEVGLALQGNHCCEVVGRLHQYTTV